MGSVEGRILLPEGSYTALVWHDESGQEGLCRFYLDAEGDFSLPCVPVGTVELVTRARGDLAADSHFPGMHVLRRFEVVAETTTQLSYP